MWIEISASGSMEVFSKMSAFYLLSSVQFASVFFLGFSLATALMMRDKGPQSSGWLLLAPALGATFYFSAGTIMHSLGFRAVAVFSALTGVSAFVSILLLGTWKRQALRAWLVGTAACFFAAATAIALNSADLAFAGLDYFPLTNDDTFSYIGLIDQIRTTGWIEPRVSYPAGYAPLIDHAVFTRTPGAIFVADFADILKLETHSAFFLSQRTALPMIALGASATVMIATGSWLATMLCFASLVCGNVLLHQILQQFNSSTMGAVIGTAVIALAIWTVRSERSQSEIVAGHGLVGWSCGTMAMTSMEAHPFYLIAFGLVAILPIVRDWQWKRAILCAAVFVVAYVATSFPFVIKVWPALIGQFVTAGNGHPGDWIASPRFLMQATGVTLTTAARLMSYRIIPVITSIAVLTTFVIAVAVLGWNSRKVAGFTKVLPSDQLALFLFVITVSFIQAFLYARGSGYGLLKLTDYFAFLPAVVISVAAYEMGLTDTRFTERTLVGLIAAYCVVAFVEKMGVLGRYEERTAGMPLPSAYRLDAIGSSKVVFPDLSAEPLNLFLYENRYETTKILIRPSESYRFSPLGERTAEPRDVARMFQVGNVESTLADITYPAEMAPPVLKTIPAAGQVHLYQPDNHWLPPEGNSVGLLSRWLSASGHFVIFGPLAANKKLEVHLAPGPDLRADNRIEIYIAGQLVQSVAPSDLPLVIRAPLAAQSSLEDQGEIRIVGPTAGIRQISVMHLGSVAR
jgi:hypothetical protein